MMSRFIRYALLQFKRVYKLSLYSIAASFIMLSILLGIGYIAFSLDSSAEDVKKVHIAIVGNPEESYIGIGISALKSLDSSRHSIDFENLSEEEAKKSLEEGRIAGYLLISDDFLSALGRGEHGKLIYVSKQGAILADNIVKEIADIISVSLFNSEKAIYAMQDIVRDKKSGDLSKVTEDMNRLYVSRIFARSKLYEVENLNLYEDIEVKDYYTVALLAFFIMLAGLGLSGLLVKRDFSIYKILAASGFSASLQVFTEYMAAYAFNLISMILPLTVLHLLKTLSVIDIDVTALGITALYISLAFTALYQLIYEAIHDYLAAVSTIFILSISMAYLAGVFYPISFFSDTTVAFTSLLPGNIALELMLENIDGFYMGAGAFALNSYTVVFILLSILIRSMKIRGSKYVR